MIFYFLNNLENRCHTRKKQMKHVFESSPPLEFMHGLVGPYVQSTFRLEHLGSEGVSPGLETPGTPISHGRQFKGDDALEFSKSYLEMQTALLP
jgi:hypothetical protein